MEEKSQDQIKFENICLRLELAWFNGYPLKSVGNIIHWFAGFEPSGIYYDSIRIGDGEIILYDKVIAKYSFDEDNERIIFDFLLENIKDDVILKGYLEYMDNNQRIYLNGLKKYKNPYKN